MKGEKKLNCGQNSAFSRAREGVGCEYNVKSVAFSGKWSKRLGIRL